MYRFFYLFLKFSLLNYQGVRMRKKIMFLVMLNIGYVFAQGEIVYLIPGEVFANSKILTTKFQQQQTSYKQQSQALLTQINKTQQETDKVGQSQARLEQLSLKLYTLQNQVESLNSQNSAYNNKLQNDYMVYVRKASNELYLQNKYAYILNSSAIVITDPKNDISPEISQLADKLYLADQK